MNRDKDGNGAEDGYRGSDGNKDEIEMHIEKKRIHFASLENM